MKISGAGLPAAPRRRNRWLEAVVQLTQLKFGLAAATGMTKVATAFKMPFSSRKSKSSRDRVLLGYRFLRCVEENFVGHVDATFPMEMHHLKIPTQRLVRICRITAYQRKKLFVIQTETEMGCGRLHTAKASASVSSINPSISKITALIILLSNP